MADFYNHNSDVLDKDESYVPFTESLRPETAKAVFKAVIERGLSGVAWVLWDKYGSRRGGSVELHWNSMVGEAARIEEFIRTKCDHALWAWANVVLRTIVLANPGQEADHASIKTLLKK